MKKIILFTIAIILVCLMGVSCDSKKSSSNICPICHESMEGKKTVDATLLDGRKVKVCASCYAVGRQAGYVY